MASYANARASRTGRRSAARLPYGCWSLLALAASCSGCVDTEAIVAARLLERQQQQLEEVDLGQFRIDLPRLPGESRGGLVTFHAFGKVPHANRTAFDAALAAAGPALRHAMLTMVRRLPDEALEEATLDQLRTCVAHVVNQAIGKELVESVGFRKFMYTAM